MSLKPIGSRTFRNRIFTVRSTQRLTVAKKANYLCELWQDGGLNPGLWGVAVGT